MKLISHRGNISGPSPLENDPSYVNETLRMGFEVEVDVWLIEDQLLLGHDKPEYFVDEKFLKQNGLWCHAKNLDAMCELQKIGVENYFWHQDDDVALTSSGYLWTFPGKELTSISIAVMPEQVARWDISNVAGICSDNIARFI